MKCCSMCGEEISNRSKTGKCFKCLRKLGRKRRQVRLRAKQKCAACGKNSVIPGEHCSGCNERSRRNLLLRKIKAMLHYENKCFCCGEDRIAFLTMDHTNGGGNKQLIGSRIYEWLIQNDYPDGFRVACNNCNSGASINKGICPHGI